MSLFPSLGKTPHLSDVFKAFPEAVRPLLEYHDIVLRGESPLTVSERELIAAFISGLNACTFCYGAHKIYARLFGADEAVIDAMVKDLETAPVPEKMRPILAYVKKLTRLPSTLRAADAQAVYEAGWSERALYDAVQVCALFNFMNRIIEGTGVSFDYEQNPPSEADLQDRRTRSYTDFGRQIGIIRED